MQGSGVTLDRASRMGTPLPLTYIFLGDIVSYEIGTQSRVLWDVEIDHEVEIKRSSLDYV